MQGKDWPQEKAVNIRNRIRGNFDRAAASYAGFEASSGFFRGLLREVLKLAPPLADKRVIDVGCGSGASLDLLRERVGPRGEVWGLDLSLGMLREAKRRLGSSVNLVAADGCRYSAVFRAPFDAVVYNAVLFMLPSARESLVSAHEVLRSGGWVLLSHLDTVLLPDGTALAKLLERRGMGPGRHALSPWPTVAEALEDLFERVTAVEFDVPMEPSFFDAFYGLEPMSAGLLPRMPFAERRAVLADLANEWRQNGHVVTQRWILASAMRRG